MTAKGCTHLLNFKRLSKNKETYKGLHATFITSDSPKCKKTKLTNAWCRICKSRGPNIHACLECIYFTCREHRKDHAKANKHTLSMELHLGQIYCNMCKDFVYDHDMDAIAKQNAMSAGKFKRRLFQWTSWDATEEERELLKRTENLYITPESATGLRGLLNLGSTCFMNCIVQALMHTPFLRDYFLTERHKCDGPPKNCLMCEVSKLFQEFYKGAKVPLALHELLCLIWTHARHLAGYEQQDAHEFFIAALDVLHRHCSETMPSAHLKTAPTASKCACIIDQIFTGGLQSDVVCQKCNGVSTTIDPIWDFSLDLGPVTQGGRPPSSLIDCLERFTRAEHLGSNEKTMCSNCQSYQESTKQLTMKTLPIVISFHLKRFQHYEEIEKKISTQISFPEMLDMTPFMSKPEEASPFPSDNRYALFAVINHLGQSINMGHYTAFVRQQEDFWYKCDDDVITKASLKEVLESEGYLLFYHKHVIDYV